MCTSLVSIILEMNFWEDMNEVRRWYNGPICIAGDMNAIKTNVERNRGVGDSRNMTLLNNYIMDHGITGGSFTWSNNQAIPLLCRLDRFLFNHDFEEAFLKCSSNYVNKTHLRS